MRVTSNLTKISRYLFTSQKQNNSTYYSVLGIEPTSSINEIKKAYSILAKQYHPDVSKDPKAQTKFDKISEAFNTLSDKEKRRVYDDGLGLSWGASYSTNFKDQEFFNFYESLGKHCELSFYLKILKILECLDHRMKFWSF
jgi:curved DNA-binding protein CbpA